MSIGVDDVVIKGGVKPLEYRYVICSGLELAFTEMELTLSSESLHKLAALFTEIAIKREADPAIGSREGHQ